MDILSGAILGFIQGLTEFIPVSSSGHLILAREIFGLQSQYGLSFDAVLQLATSLAVLLYFRHDFLQLLKTAKDFVLGKQVELKNKILLMALIFGTIPAVVFGLLLEGYMETTFRSAELVGVTLLLGALIFYIAEKIAKQTEAVTPKKGFIIGFFQSLALIPGMSRSGMTISGGLFLGLKREEAARFGFMLAFPIIFGSGVKKLIELGINGGLADTGMALLSGAVVAFFVGIVAIHYLLKYLKNHTLNIFIIYRVVLALIIFLAL